MTILKIFMRIKTLLFVYQILLLSLKIKATNAETFAIYLNSYAHCGHEKTFEVSLEKEYLIKPDISPDTGTRSFRQCEVTFHSHRSDGHVCLIQEGNGAKIYDSNAELKIYDGLGNPDDKVIGHLKSYPNILAFRDVCSMSRYITFFLSEIEKTNSADIRKLELSFRIVDIRSNRRKLYLDGTSCNYAYDLLDSEISLVNRPNFPGMTVSSLTPECVMKFKKVETKSNSSICVAYIPSSNVTCGSHWRFVVSTGDYDIQEKFLVYRLQCNESRAKTLHAWCGKVENSFITIAFWRDDAIFSNSSIEPPGEFRFLVTDYDGSTESLLDKIRLSMGGGESAKLGLLEIVMICLCVVLIIVLIIILYMNRQKLPCYQYSAVKKRDSAGGDEAHI